MESGSIQEVVERLKSWCLRQDRGLARVEWDSAYARQEVVNRLKLALGGASISLVEIRLPPGESAEATVARLIEQLRSGIGQVVSITGIEWAFPERGNRLDTLAALSFQRETLASFPVRQIWWIPSFLTERFVLGVPDLDSWFQVRLHLTEVPSRASEAGRELEQVDRKTVSVTEARSTARRFWERLEAARAQNVPEDRIWTELAQPAVEALRSAGLEREADEILSYASTGREELENEISELSATRGPEDPEVLALSQRFASTLFDQGDFAGARRHQERVLEVRTRALGEVHPDTLTSMHNLALTLWAQGDLDGARHLQERVLDIRTHVLGEEHSDTLTSMNNLAATLYAQGDLDGARRLEERVLEVRMRVLGEEYPETLTSMNNLAETLREQGNLDGARRLQERVLEVSTRVLGEEHPNTLRSMNNLALTLRGPGDLDGVRRLLERVLEVSTRVLGKEHPATLTSMNNLAHALSEQGDLPDALKLLRRCLVGRRKLLGENHPDTIASAEFLKRLEEQTQAIQPEH